MRNRLPAVLLALSLVFAGACGGGDDDEVDTAASSSTTTTEAAAPDAPTGGDSPSTTTAEGGPGVSVSAGGGKSTATTAKTSSGSGSGSASSGAYKPAAPGSYSYRTTGKASSPAFGEQPIDREDALKVEPPAGSDQKNVRTSQEGSTEQVFRFAPDGVRLVSMKISNRQVTKEFRPNPPAMVLPYPLTVGQEWSWKMTSTDNATNVEGRFKFVRREAIDVGGESHQAAVIEATVVTSGDVTSTSRQTIWTSESLRLILQEKNVSDGQFGQVTFHSETTSKLKSTKPA